MNLDLSLSKLDSMYLFSQIKLLVTLFDCLVYENLNLNLYSHLSFSNKSKHFIHPWKGTFYKKKRIKSKLERKEIQTKIM